jgi:7-carboxy-7-deazaguanine synthase
MQQLRINEIFFSIQGESTRSGLPTSFIRLSGCPLRCLYCDTEYAFKGGDRMSIDSIIEAVKKNPTKYITVTGGEPLAQAPCIDLMSQLAELGYYVSLETSGAFDVSKVDPRVMLVMDLKTPDSGEESKNLFSNLSCLKRTDQIKFVICSQKDYLWSKDIIEEHQLADKVDVLMSASWGAQDLSQLANWILEDGLQVRFQAQLHKVIWPNNFGPGV